MREKSTFDTWYDTATLPENSKMVAQYAWNEAITMAQTHDLSVLLAPIATYTISTDSYGTIIYRDEKNNRHRLDGPAVIWSDGIEWWYVHGKPYTNFKDFQKAANLTDNQITILKLKYSDMRTQKKP